MKQSNNKKIPFNKSLLKIIVCPVSGETLQWNSKKNELISKTSSLAYPVVDGIPILIKEKARKL
jgi:uncharacterized protein YbaR (Trm112 family)